MELISSFPRRPSHLPSSSASSSASSTHPPPINRSLGVVFFFTTQSAVVVVVVALVMLSDFTHLATTLSVDHYHFLQHQNLQLLHQDPDITYESFCETESFNATCDPGTAILMTYAFYGRMSLSRCAKIDYGHIGCASDVMELADTRCSGRSSCEITIPDALFAKTRPCPEDLKPYLNAGYSCVPVQSPGDGEECFSTSSGIYPIFVRDLGGFLSNLVTDSTGCGSLSFPWTVEAGVGQRVHLTLYDFNVAIVRPLNFIQPRCPLYAVIKERISAAEVKKFDVCGGLAREKPVYTSQTNRVEIGLAKNEDQANGPYFMFRYEVVGCVDIQPLPGAWFRRDGNRLVVKCNFTSDQYHLKCAERQWIGEIRNCSSAASSTVLEKYEHTDLTITYGSSIMIMIVTALGMGLFVLSAGLIILARRKTLFAQNKNRSTLQQQSPRNFLSYDDYVTAPSSRLGNGSIQMTSKRYSYVDLSLQTTSGQSLTGSSGELSVNTPLVNAFATPFQCRGDQRQLYCCECHTSGCDRMSASDDVELVTSGRYNALQKTSVRMETNVSYTEDKRNRVGDNRRSSTAKVAMQTDDVKLQRSLQKLSLEGVGSESLIDAEYTSRDVEKMSTVVCNDFAPPIQLF